MYPGNSDKCARMDIQLPCCNHFNTAGGTKPKPALEMNFLSPFLAFCFFPALPSVVTWAYLCHRKKRGHTFRGWLGHTELGSTLREVMKQPEKTAPTWGGRNIFQDWVLTDQNFRLLPWSLCVGSYMESYSCKFWDTILLWCTSSLPPKNQYLHMIVSACVFWGDCRECHSGAVWREQTQHSPEVEILQENQGNNGPPRRPERKHIWKWHQNNIYYI